jgi:hypothetical protein
LSPLFAPRLLQMFGMLWPSALKWKIYYFKNQCIKH